MDIIIRFAIGIVALHVAQVIIGGTAVYWFRRRKNLEPTWSWLRAMVAFFVLGLWAVGAGIDPFVLVVLLDTFGDRSLAGLVVALIPLVVVAVYLVGLKRSTGLDVLGTLFLAFGIGVACLVVTVVLSKVLQVDLYSLQVNQMGSQP